MNLVEGKLIMPIIPSEVSYYDLPGGGDLDYRAICCFAAIGFFLDSETFFLNRKACRPASTYLFDEKGRLTKETKDFSWYYSPRDISFDQVVTEFGVLFENIVAKQTVNRNIVLPISGGLDSRSLAAALIDSGKVYAYSYQFNGGFPENRIGREIAQVGGFPFSEFNIEPGYLWKDLEKSALLNGCFADFINPRQVCVAHKLREKGDIFLLGHWGDVLFDSMGVDSGLPFDLQVEVIQKKLVKRGGMSLATDLWKAWGLPGKFKDYLRDRISLLHSAILIDDANARIRAFKSLYWAPRWTSVNLIFFQNILPIAVPYYDDEMCRWVCSIPEQHLAGRRIQIEYIKRKSEELASVPWQSYYPCNLYNYGEFNSLKLIPHRAWLKATREFGQFLASTRKVTRNWEIQFLGDGNDNHLRGHIMDREFHEFVPAKIIHKYYEQFKLNGLENAHAISMLLNLSLFNKLFLK